MNQCQRCGTFFEGPVCPDCGMPRTTLCPRCGAPNYATAPACGCCGLLFAPQRYTPPKPRPSQPLYEQPAPRAVHAPKKPSPAPAAAVQEKSKSRRVEVTVTVILLAIVIAIVAVVAYFISLHSIDGTYYRIDSDHYIYEEYLTLDGRTWKDDGGETGKFTLSGNSIVIKQSLMGETIILFTGIVEDGQLRLRFMGQELIFAQRGRYASAIADDLSFEEYGKGYAVTGRGQCKNTIIRIPSSHLGLPVVAINYLRGDDIKSVEIPNSVTEIGDRAFSGCKGLTSITIPNSVTSIGKNAFYNCTGLTSIMIPDSVTSIREETFSGCTKLTSITIGSGVTSIGEKVFSGCTKLTSITIGSGVTSIGKNAFYNCSGLTSILVEQGNPIYHSAGNCLIETASSTLISGCKTSTIPDDGSVTSIGEDVFDRVRDTTTKSKILSKQPLSRA